LPFIFSEKKNKFIYSEGDPNGQPTRQSLINIFYAADKDDLVFIRCSDLLNKLNNNNICVAKKNKIGFESFVTLQGEKSLEEIKNQLFENSGNGSNIDLSNLNSYLYSSLLALKQKIYKVLPFKSLLALKNFYIWLNFYLYKLKNSNSVNADLSKLAINNKNFISHAGGSIENFKYTNSIEAVKNSINHGVNLIELDLMLTKDNKIVAVHDWDQWSNSTRCIQKEVPTEELFMKCKFLEIYNPINEKVINKLMNEYKDFILVTDKINNPKLIKDRFKYHDRIIMELFTKKAVFEARSLGIKFLINEILVDDYIYENKFPEWVTLAEGIAVSRLYAMEHYKRFISLKDAGLKIYVYGLNEGKYRDTELDVFCDLNQVISGMYIDDLKFTENLQCN